MTVVIIVLFAISVFFSFVGVLGILRYKDFFSRSQASTCISTMGAINVTLGCFVYYVINGFPAVWYIRTLIILLLVMMTDAISCHSLAKGAYKFGLRPVGGFVKDDYHDDGFDELVEYEYPVEEQK